jgi:adenylate cyclase
VSTMIDARSIVAAPLATQPTIPARMAEAFAAEEWRGLGLAFRLRLVALLLIALFLAMTSSWPEMLYYFAIMLGFIATGALSLVPANSKGPWRAAEWTRWVVPLADLALVTFAVVYPNPLGGDDLLTPPLRLRLDNFLYPLTFVVLSTLTLSPRQVIWTGASAALCWMAATYWVGQQSGIRFLPGFCARPECRDFATKTGVLYDPYTLTAAALVKQVLLMLIISAVLASAVRRARSLALRQVRVAAERAQLARYFSANLVDEIADTNRPVGAIRKAEVAVLFVDIVGFTRLAETISPEEAIAFLRDFHARMQAAVFAHGGTLDKYLGDGLMASFGTALSGGRDAANALAAAREMAARIARWNDERAAEGVPSIAIGIGLHWGSVVLGDIGGENRLEFATIGDTVNVASRLEALTRVLDVEIVASGDLLRAVRATTPAAEAEALLNGFVATETQVLRGREASIGIYARKRSAGPA